MRRIDHEASGRGGRTMGRSPARRVSARIQRRTGCRPRSRGPPARAFC